MAAEARGRGRRARRCGTWSDPGAYDAKAAELELFIANLAQCADQTTLEGRAAGPRLP